MMVQAATAVRMARVIQNPSGLPDSFIWNGRRGLVMYSPEFSRAFARITDESQQASAEFRAKLGQLCLVGPNAFCTRKNITRVHKRFSVEWKHQGGILMMLSIISGVHQS